MNRLLSLLVTSIAINACHTYSGNGLELKNKVDSLEQKLSKTYKPGFGEFMSGIQVHHAKLWFAGKNKNWALADFEMHEIKEALEDLKIFQTERPETKHLDMLNSPLDSINKSIQIKDITSFTSNFTVLTNTCNNCHLE
ncbi:MAG: hypothetical protein ACM3H8_00175, partial [Sphingobacteriales bacterium]